MMRFVHDDIEFTLHAAAAAWDLTRLRADGSSALVGTGLFAGLDADAAQQRARTLARLAYPVGVHLVPPDLLHPLRAGELRLVAPAVSRPLFVGWDADSTSFPRQVAPGAIDIEGHHGHQE